MTDKLHSDVAEIKKFLIGTEFDRKDCLSYQFDETVKKLSIIQNQVNTLMQDREKRIAEEQAKTASKLAMRKFLSSITLGLIKMKTGI